MPLKPLGNALFGEVIEHDDYAEIRKELQTALEGSSLSDLDSPRFDRQVQVSGRQMLAQLEGKEKQQYQVEVMAVGPDCKEVQVGDIAILPPDGGTMVTVVDEETREYQRVFCITEDAVLAVFRED